VVVGMNDSLFGRVVQRRPLKEILNSELELSPTLVVMRYYLADKDSE
jgi:hypothetical protein